MYGFSQDEKHLLFIDCFGLTRLSAPKKVKTDRKITGSEAAGIATVSRDGALAGSYEDIWDKSVVWKFPELKSAKRFDRFRERGLVVHPAGTHYIVYKQGKLTLEPLGPARVLLPLRLDAVQSKQDKPAKPVSFDLSQGGHSLPALTLGGDEQPSVSAPLRVAHDGTLLLFDGNQLICAALEGETLTLRWRRPVQTPARARLDIYADSERCVYVLHRGRTWTIVEHGHDAKASERSFEIESLGTPVVAGRYLAYQPTNELVRRRDLVSGEETEHSLAVYAAKRPHDLPNEGVGTIFAGAGGKLLVLAAHRESILDLIKGVEIPRKLPAKELELRQALMAITQPYVLAARLAGVCIELGRVEIETKRNSVSVTHRISGGESLFGALLASHSQAVWNNPPLPAGWRMSSYGSHGGISNSSADVSVAALIEGYTGLAAAGVRFASTVGLWADIFEVDRHSTPPSDPASGALLAQALTTVLRDGPAAALDFAALAARGAPSLDDARAALDSYVQRSDEFPHDGWKLCGGLFNHVFGAQAAELWAHCLFESASFTNGGRLWELDHYGLRPLLEAHPGASERFVAWFEAHEIPDDGRRNTLEQIKARVVV